MPQTEYAARSDSVLAWKKKEQLGRFDPAAVGAIGARVRNWQRDVDERGTFTSTIAPYSFPCAPFGPASRHPFYIEHEAHSQLVLLRSLSLSLSLSLVKRS
jgi:hypothetical protein